MDPLPQPTSFRYRSLDGWRGAACIGVVLYHLRPEMGQYPIDAPLYQLLSYGWLGVPVFFVISGYCISATAAATINRNGSTIDYFVRRVRRIYPPYLIVFAFTVLIKTAVGRNLLPTSVSSLLGKTGDTVVLSPSQWWGNATLTESWRYLAFGDARKYLLEHSWTLCYEEQFYLLFGLFLVFARRRFYTAALLLSAPILGCQILSAATAERFDGAFFDGRWLLFAAGVLVHWQLHRATAVWRLSVPPLLALTAIGLAITANSFDLPLRLEFFTGLIFSLFLLICYRYDDRLSQARWFGPLRYCGQICFSLYLVHWFIAKAVNVAAIRYYPTLTTEQLATKAILGLLISVAFGAAYYYVVERHFLSRAQIAVVRRLGSAA